MWPRKTAASLWVLMLTKQIIISPLLNWIILLSWRPLWNGWLPYDQIRGESFCNNFEIDFEYFHVSTRRLLRAPGWEDEREKWRPRAHPFRTQRLLAQQDTCSWTLHPGARRSRRAGRDASCRDSALCGQAGSCRGWRRWSRAAHWWWRAPQWWWWWKVPCSEASSLFYACRWKAGAWCLVGGGWWRGRLSEVARKQWWWWWREPLSWQMLWWQ